jgi:hypothetical protein
VGKIIPLLELFKYIVNIGDQYLIGAKYGPPTRPAN